MVKFETKVIDVVKRTSSIKSFRFERPEDVDFNPGQFFLFTIKIDGVGVSKHFSFSNSPTEKKYIEFTKRITKSQFSKALDKLKKGDPASVKMPFGSFTFMGEHKKIAFLSGGIGITPIRSICKFVIDKALKTDIVLLYSNRAQDSIAFKEDFDDFQAANKNIRAIHTLTSQDVDKNTWQGEIGYIDDKMIKKYIPDFKDRVFYICGPTPMVTSMVNLLKDPLGVEENNIRHENFTGY